MNKSTFKKIIRESIEEELIGKLKENSHPLSNYMDGNENDEDLSKQTSIPRGKNMAKEDKEMLNEAIVYHTIIFAQGDNAIEPLKIFNEKGVNAAIKYLAEWDYGGENEHSPTKEPPWGTDDRIFKKGAYILSVNQNFGYISLTRTERVRKEKPFDINKPLRNVDEMTSTGAVAGFQSPNWVDPDPERKKMKKIASKSVGGELA